MAEYAVADVVMAAATFFAIFEANQRYMANFQLSSTQNCYQSIGLPMSACRPMCMKYFRENT